MNLTFFQIIGIVFVLSLGVDLIIWCNCYFSKFKILQKIIIRIPIVLIVVMLYVFIFQCTYRTEDIVLKQNNIVSCKDYSSIDGSFIIGTGYIKSELNYIVMIETDKGYMRQTLPQDKTYIVEGNETPHYEKIQNDPVCKRKSDGKILGCWNPNFTGHYYYKLYVPKNTIVKEFNINN